MFESLCTPWLWETCAACPSRWSGLCAALGVHDIARLGGIKHRRRRLPAGSFLFREGDISGDSFIVLSGWVAVAKMTADGARHILDFALPGSFLGYDGIHEGRLGTSAQCLTLTELCPLPRAGLDRELEHSPTLARHLVHLVACREARAQDHLINVTRRGGSQRLAHLLLELFHRSERQLPSAARNSMVLPLTLADLGDAIGLTHVHVSRMLRGLRENGILSLGHRRLDVLDPAAFIAAAGFDGSVIDDDVETNAPARALDDRAAAGAF